MHQTRLGMALGALTAMAGLAGCASEHDPFGAGRTAFDNPYAALVIENGPVGPYCDEGVLRDERCWINGVAHPASYRFARLPDGTLIRLDRNQRQWERERWEAIQSRIDVLEALEKGTPLPPGSPALPENQSCPVPPPPPSGTTPD